MASFIAKLAVASVFLVGTAIAAAVILGYPSWGPWKRGDLVTKVIYEGGWVSKVEVDIDVGSIEVVSRKSDEVVVRLEYVEGCAVYEVNEEDGSLAVKVEYVCKIRGDGEGPSLIVELPGALNYLDLNLDVGRLLVKDVDVVEASLSVDVGMIEVKDSAFRDTIEVSVDTGEAKIRGVSLPSDARMSVSVDIGEASISLDAPRGCQAKALESVHW